MLLDRENGMILDHAKIAAHVDEIAYDPTLRRAYCSSWSGSISVVQLKGEKLESLGSVPDQQGSGNIAVNPKDHRVWVAFHTGNRCFVQSFQP